MIRYALKCDACATGFEGWFRNGLDFDAQAARGLLECPSCGSPAVSKALMRPAVATPGRDKAEGRSVVSEPPREMAEMYRKLQDMAREVRAKADYVGSSFAEEARRIHYGESECRQIYGEASAPEVRGLLEEGITALPMPPLPEDKN